MMAEPKVRFKRDDGSSYPAWNITKMRTLTHEYKARNKTKLPLEIYSVNNEVGFLPQSEQFEDAGYLSNTDTSIYMIVPPNYFAYNPARINIGSIGYQNVGHDVQVSSLYEVFRTTEELDDYFLWYWFHTPIFNKAVLSLQEGGVRLYFYYDKLKETSISFPCLEEQKKIADFLSSVDEVITASEQEVANLETQKKAVMKKIFSQEVRFKRDDGSDFPEWEQKVFTDVARLINGRAYSADEMLESGKYMILRVGNLFSNNEYYYSDMELEEDKYIDDGDLIYAWSATFGPRIYRGEKCIYHYHIWKVIPLSVEKDYFLHFLYADVDNLQSELNGGTMKHITKEVMENRIVPLPCKDEQNLIARFLSDFDEALAATKKELELWKELRKGLLQQMLI